MHCAWQVLAVLNKLLYDSQVNWVMMVVMVSPLSTTQVFSISCTVMTTPCNPNDILNITCHPLLSSPQTREEYTQFEIVTEPKKLPISDIVPVSYGEGRKFGVQSDALCYCNQWP